VSLVPKVCKIGDDYQSGPERPHSKGSANLIYAHDSFITKSLRSDLHDLTDSLFGKFHLPNEGLSKRRGAECQSLPQLIALNERYF
jgi:hypothetical protein